MTFTAQMDCANSMLHCAHCYTYRFFYKLNSSRRSPILVPLLSFSSVLVFFFVARVRVAVS